MTTKQFRLVALTCLLLATMLGVAGSAAAPTWRGAAMTAHADVNFTGATQTVQQPVPNLPDGRGLIFFDRVYFRGSTTTLVTSESPNIKIRGRGSVQIRGGGIWELCDHRGRCATIDRDVANLYDLRLSDRITSVREMRGTPQRSERR